MPSGGAKACWAELRRETRTELEVAHSELTRLAASVHEPLAAKRLQDAPGRLLAEMLRQEAESSLEEEVDTVAPTDADTANVKELVGKIRSFRDSAESYGALLRLADDALSASRVARARVPLTAPPAMKCANPATPHYHPPYTRSALVDPHWCFCGAALP